MTLVAAVAVVLGVPAIAFTLWPLLRRGSDGRRLLGLPPDARETLLERKAAALRALRELEFEHQAGHVSDDDYAGLRARYEGEAAEVLTELDHLPRPAAPAPVAVSTAARARGRGWRHPAVLGASALALVIFGVALGVGIVRYTEPDPMAGVPPTGTRPLASLEPEAPGAANAPRTVTPEMMQGMLQAARASLFAGRYAEAIAAYQAVLKRDPKNVDAMTHLGLIVAVGAEGQGGAQMVDHALELFDRALALDPNYPPALLYRGQVLYESRRDVPAAIESWEKFVAVAPAGEDRDRVSRLIAEARGARPDEGARAKP